MLPTGAYSDNPSTSFAAKFVHTSLNKNRCSINRVLVSQSKVLSCIGYYNYWFLYIWYFICCMLSICSVSWRTLYDHICAQFFSWASVYTHVSYSFIKWTPTGRRLITGSQSGEFTLWNGQSFNFEMILQVPNCIGYDVTLFIDLASMTACGLFFFLLNL